MIWDVTCDVWCVWKLHIIQGQSYTCTPEAYEFTTHGCVPCDMAASLVPAGRVGFNWCKVSFARDFTRDGVNQPSWCVAKTVTGILAKKNKNKLTNRALVTPTACTLKLTAFVPFAVEFNWPDHDETMPTFTPKVVLLKNTLKTACCYIANFVVTDGNGGCRTDSIRCHQRQNLRYVWRFSIRDFCWKIVSETGGQK